MRGDRIEVHPQPIGRGVAIDEALKLALLQSLSRARNACWARATRSLRVKVVCPPPRSGSVSK